MVSPGVFGEPHGGAMRPRRADGRDEVFFTSFGERYTRGVRSISPLIRPHKVF